MKVGRRVSGRRVKLVNAADKVSKVGEIYELHIKTDKPVNDVAALLAFGKLHKGLNDLFNAKLLYLENKGNDMIMDISGSPFGWFDLLVWLPEILMTVGVIVLAISVYIVSMYNKYLALALIIGSALAGVGWLLHKERERTIESVVGELHGRGESVHKS